MRIELKKIIFAIQLFCGMQGVMAQQQINLQGLWQVQLDSLNQQATIQLPGTTDQACLGVPCLLTPRLEKTQLLHLTRKHAFIGTAHYRRTIHISAAMANRTLQFKFERVLWKSQLYVDGKIAGTFQESLVTPHLYYIEGLKEGKHEIELVVDNRKQHDISVNNLAHAYTNDTQVIWNGVLGEMSLTAVPHVEVGAVSVYPDIVNRKIRIVTHLYKHDAKQIKGVLSTKVYMPNTNELLPIKHQSIKVDADTLQCEAWYELNDSMQLWSEFSPAVYKLEVTFNAKNIKSAKQVSFGMRELNGKSGVLKMNGKRIFLRGTLECCIFPLTGTPPTDETGWEKVFCTAKNWGLNHLRFHSYCPPEAAFQVADKMGFYLQVELPNWSLTMGKDVNTSRFLYDEFNHIIAQYGNHPSFCMLSVGNELQPDFDFLNTFVAYMKKRDTRHLYATTTFTFEKGHGGHAEPQDDYLVTQWTDKGWVRGQGVFDSESPHFNKDYSQTASGIDAPLISHEIGQYAVYPNLQEIDKYTGTLAPLNFEAIKKDLNQKGLLHKAKDFLFASGKLANLLYKEEIERALKTPQFSGFQLLGLQDFSGQGTALVGLVDAFWDSKGVTKAQDFRGFCAPVVPLAYFEKAVYSGSEPFRAQIKVANFSEQYLKQNVRWSLTNAKGDIYAQGLMKEKTLISGTTTLLDSIQIDLSSISKACKLKLQVSIDNTEWANSWSIWVYPTTPALPVGEVLLTDNVTKAYQALCEGKKVLLSPHIELIRGLEGKFVPVFWSPVHFPKQAGTMGLLCNPLHPALRDFPTEMHTDWQWWNLAKQSKVLVIDSIANQLEPIVENIDNFTNNRHLVSIFQTNIGSGKLLMTSMDALSDYQQKPEKKQLLISLLNYMNSTGFAPITRMQKTAFHSLFQNKGSKDKKLNATSIYE